MSNPMYPSCYYELDAAIIKSAAKEYMKLVCLEHNASSHSKANYRRRMYELESYFKDEGMPYMLDINLKALMREIKMHAKKHNYNYKEVKKLYDSRI